MKRLLAAAATVLAVFAVVAPATVVDAKEYGKCGFDSDCHSGVKCRSGKCADSAGSSCAFDSDCGGAKCRSGKCASAPDGSCAFDSDCGRGGKCSSSKCR
ncbi:MAG: hypothetical protein JNL38_09160 [Myxococcales bacterium]|jgi:hypothetical protein|nr:hypothetical protein [Myxococcales bacterium]